ncbi:MAG: hypothetical protein J0M02_09210, partial [Planctomycetes bacterium]|nr:hypothetical protein [Planctomycetota bacterium]
MTTRSVNDITAAWPQIVALVRDQTGNVAGVRLWLDTARVRAVGIEEQHLVIECPTPTWSHQLSSRFGPAICSALA